MLCGTGFGLGARGRELQRHRLFETSFPVAAPACQHSGRPVLGIYGAHVRDRRRPVGKNHVSGSNLPISVGREAMQIDWMTSAELSEAIPPAYSRYVARLASANRFGGFRQTNRRAMTPTSNEGERRSP